MLKKMQKLPAATETLAALTSKTRPSWWRLILDDDTRVARNGVEWKAGLGREWRLLAAWSHDDPREALEVLESRALAPPHDTGRLWRCCTCDGTGLVRPGFEGQAGASLGGWLCGDCSGMMFSPSPGCVADVASVAFVGLDRWLRVEAMAGVLLRYASVAWWPMRRMDLLSMSCASMLGRDAADTIPEAAMREGDRRASCDAGGARPPQHLEPPDRCREDARAAWPVILELAEIGALPARIDADRGVVSLAVEIPSSE